MDNNKNTEELKEDLQKCFQSFEINFLIGSGASSPAIKTAKNIEEELNNLKNQPENQLDCYKKKLKDFINPIIEVSKKLITIDENKDKSKEDTDKKIIEVLKSYTDFLEFIQQMLSKRDINKSKFINIFTTNYDLFLEKASENNDLLVINDGFKRSCRLDNKALFSPSNFFYSVFYNDSILAKSIIPIPCINFIKLHGSISWKYEESHIVNEIPQQYNENHPFIVAPTNNKFAETVTDQTRYELLRIYKNSLYKKDTCLIVFGFSFADEHILKSTEDVLKNNPTLIVFIFIYNKSDKSDNIDRLAKSYPNVKLIALDKLLDFVRFNKFLEDSLNYNKDRK